MLLISENAYVTKYIKVEVALKVNTINKSNLSTNENEIQVLNKHDNFCFGYIQNLKRVPKRRETPFRIQVIKIKKSIQSKLFPVTKSVQ